LPARTGGGRGPNSSAPKKVGVGYHARMNPVRWSVVLLCTLACDGTVSGGSPEESFARQVLTAYKAKDGETMNKLAGNDSFTDPARASSLFDPTKGRWEAVSGWDGKTLDCRTREDRVDCQFYKFAPKPPDAQNSAVVRLEKQGTGFRFEDIQFMKVDRFEALPKQQPPQ